MFRQRFERAIINATRAGLVHAQAPGLTEADRGKPQEAVGRAVFRWRRAGCHGGYMGNGPVSFGHCTLYEMRFLRCFVLLFFCVLDD